MKKTLIPLFALALAASPLAACDMADHAKVDTKAELKAAVKTDKKASYAKSKGKGKVIAQVQAKQKKI